ncbi:MAG: hypothetical protein A2150_06425 [Candidatus Muproteobacteria bacterium RBG_16_64_11]|uniref:DUF3619 domain-containing protein n=1 Tax=Candidatus Muproteobacteria bacterium RBG_16_64_11 TaxID=1817758 RepID=A0A1F6TAS3_9PROT|nr:MAG: hypothetical protein A2150_06425 [Candidatus Muproteobacteria bacterium RBG_16_64_11]
MTTGNDDREFIAKAKSILDRSADTLDARQRARLRAVRRAALAQTDAPRFFARPLLALGAAAALATVGVIGLWTWQHSEPPPLAATVEDAELLFAADNVELYRHLEFYRWLANKERSG